MISGFLISYILVERKAYPNVRCFYVNRYLRLYPVYFVVALLTFFVFASASAAGRDVKLFTIYHSAPFAANFLLIFSNVTLFMQDWVMFAGVVGNKLVFLTDFSKSEVVLYPALLVPQAWTLGVELAFYLVAPYILPNKRMLLSLLALSVSLRIYLVYIGLGTKDPWSYRFFPTELSLFLLGALAHQVLLPRYQKMLSIGRIGKYASMATYFFIIFSLVYSFIPVNETLKTFVLFTLFLVLMPFTFIFQSNRKWDKWIGDLSYPIYICHMLVISVTTFVFGKIVIADSIIVMGEPVPIASLLVGISPVVFSICFAILLNKFIGSPVESLRNKFRAKS